ncbi:hypothetical protein [Pseudomonas kilonensis]|uniref:Uncharacterized protein n=1 Tax=Pseudomonas kilonensis TaxID=132476 RepID=A0ABY0Y3D7_9PSED|nr:hypothetical protein [Pseudomonas kilonensis]SEC87130.1 hypothetical protein SAMN04490188_0208 [Pseudomonas kilonensis]
MFRLLTKIPIIGVILKVFNSYAYDGDVKADDQFAGILAWIKIYFFPFFICLSVAILLMPDFINSLLPCSYLSYKVEVTPGELATSILPNLLGFGIGVYALIFALDRKFVQDLQNGFEGYNKENNKSGSVLLLNTEMALPLIIITATIAIGIFQKIFIDHLYLRLASWFSFWLSMYFTLDLINNLFLMGSAHLSDNIKKHLTQTDTPPSS